MSVPAVEAEGNGPVGSVDAAHSDGGSTAGPAAGAATAARPSAAFFESLVVNNADMIAVIDERGVFRFVSDAVRRILGHEPDDLVGQNGFAFVHPDDVGLAAESLLSSVTGGGVREPLLIRLLDKDGRWRATEILTHNLIGDEVVGGLVVTARDMTARHDSELTAVENQNLFEQAFERAPIGMALVEPEGAIRRANAVLAEMLGTTIQDLIGRSLVAMAHPEDRRLAIRTAAEVLGGEEPPAIEVRFERVDGQLAWARVSATMVHDEDGVGLYAIVHVEDVTEQTRLRQELHRAATHDPLTGVLNRSGLEAQYAASVLRSPEPSAFILVDLDRFKPVNDTYGHYVGDQLLQYVAGRLTRTIRGEATIARIGGDEFVAHVAGVENVDQARVIGERIRRSLAATFVVSEHKVNVSGSIGVAFLPEPVPIEQAVMASDRASYHAKHTGGDRVVVVTVERADRPADSLA